ncbi:unannotated protein [freshwater metagenome]|uniref:Unannotated protein n=1 Tax=freshwater metagenome TaxID=449393 RepID=A0A6J7J8L4_9ZZZZ
MSVAAVVLAGGRSRRFGADKLAAEIAGSPLLDRALAAALAVAEVVVVVGPDDRPWPSGILIVREHPPFAGPFAAVVAGLEHLSHLEQPAADDVVLVIAGDLVDPGPQLSALVAALRTPSATNLAPHQVDAAVTVDADGRHQPLLAAYRWGALLDSIAGLNPNGRAAFALLDGLRVLDVPEVGTSARDIDTTEDLARETTR